MNVKIKSLSDQYRNLVIAEGKESKQAKVLKRQILELNKARDKANEAAQEMADKQLDTLGGAVKLLSSAWEGWILKMNESSGAGNFLKNVIKFLAENLEALLDLLVKVGLSWAAYSVAVKAAAVAQKIN